MCCRFTYGLFVQLHTGGKPSTWLPPGGLVEHIVKKQTTEQTNKTKLTNITLTFLLHLETEIQPRPIIGKN